jgi:hypothetical protein
MATDSLTVGGRPSGIHNTLSGATADTITINTATKTCRGQIINRSTAGFWVRLDGSAAIVAADGTIYLPAGMVFEWFIGSGTATVSIIGNGDAYSVQTLPYGSW